MKPMKPLPQYDETQKFPPDRKISGVHFHRIDWNITYLHLDRNVSSPNRLFCFALSSDLLRVPFGTKKDWLQKYKDSGG